jgi:hypothetical protein
MKSSVLKVADLIPAVGINLEIENNEIFLCIITTTNYFKTGIELTPEMSCIPHIIGTVQRNIRKAGDLSALH